VEGAKVDTDGMWIPKGLPRNELYWAKRYIDFALSSEAQRVWLEGLGLPGVAPGLKPPADLVGDPSYPTSEKDFERLILIPPKVQAEHTAEWFARFKEIMQS
jgi:putative spermidine/putrescine transport system substrate-binding protein